MKSAEGKDEGSRILIPVRIFFVRCTMGIFKFSKFGFIIYSDV